MPRVTVQAAVPVALRYRLTQNAIAEGKTLADHLTDVLREAVQKSHQK